MYIKIGLTNPYWLSMFKSVYSLLVYKDLGDKAMLSEKVMIIDMIRICNKLVLSSSYDLGSLTNKESVSWCCGKESP